MGALSRSKGKRAEREVVRLARRNGLRAERCWSLAQSPSASERACDVRITSQPYQVQVARDGFGRMYRELEGVRGYFFRSDRREWLVCLRAGDYLELLQCRERR